MKKRSACFLLLAFALISGLLMVNRWVDPHRPAQPAPTGPGHLQAEHFGWKSARPSSQEEEDAWQKRNRRDPSFQWLTPIEFYGKVVDQHGDPVPGCTAQVLWNRIGGTGKMDVKSDNKGLLSITGLQGKVLEIELFAPQGYANTTSGMHSYEYAEYFSAFYHIPDPNKPVEFKIWKYVHPEPMYRSSYTGSDHPFKRDGSIQWYDLEMGISSQGDFGLSAVQSASSDGSKKEYVFKVVAGEGCGIIETTDNPRFTPPDSGYVHEIAHTCGFRNGQQYGDQIFVFYLKTKGGIYAAVKADLQVCVAGVEPKVQIFHNPSGSRNLEYTEDLELNPKWKAPRRR